MIRKKFRRKYKHIPRSSAVKCVMWNDLTGEQQVVVRRLFSYLEDRLPEGEYQSWLESKGFYFDGYGRPLISMAYEKEGVS